MNRSPRLFGSLVGIVSGWAVGTAIYHMLLTGSCSTPPGPGEVACPPEMIQHALYMTGGIIGGIVGTALGGSWLAFGALFTGIGLGGVLAGLQPVEQGGQRWFIFFGACFLLTPAIGIVSLPFVGLRRMRARQLMENGMQGVGTLLSIEGTGMLINNNPRVRMRFRIDPVGEVMAPFEATKTATVNRFDVPKVGDSYPVWFDRDDPQDFVFATGQGAAASASQSPLRRIVEAAKQGAQPTAMPSMDVVRELNTLNELRLTGKISADEFARRTSDIINAPTA
ncbi:MAG TPA: hypothetical protein VGX28_03405 [Frankiaceae bacterium]|jgi:hypothetical protein|nr:hypothetical protein [Frankiaceae bacterium]